MPRFAYAVLRALGVYGTKINFGEVCLRGQENLPPAPYPCIVASTHSNMVVDPMILVGTAPQNRQFYFWAKVQLFMNPIGKFIFSSVGAVPVDRSSKNHHGLFQDTLKLLSAGGCLLVFPEGTSYTLPHVLELKDGVSWAALEHAAQFVAERKETAAAHDDGKDALGPRRRQKEPPPSESGMRRKPTAAARPVVVAPVGITYVRKEKWRSGVIVHYARPIEVLEFVDDFLLEPRPTVKRLTALIASKLREVTVNALDWDTLWTAETAREMLVPISEIDLRDFVPFTQRLICIFSYPAGETEQDERTKEIVHLRNQLLVYRQGLQKLKLRDQDVSDLERRRISLLHAAWRFFLAAALSLAQVLVFLPGYLTLAPILFLSWVMGRREGYVERKAQVKLATSTLLMLAMYCALFSLAVLDSGRGNAGTDAGNGRGGGGGGGGGGRWWQFGFGFRKREACLVLAALALSQLVIVSAGLEILRTLVANWHILCAVVHARGSAAASGGRKPPSRGAAAADVRRLSEEFSQVVPTARPAAVAKTVYDLVRLRQFCGAGLGRLELRAEYERVRAEREEGDGGTR